MRNDHPDEDEEEREEEEKKKKSHRQVSRLMFCPFPESWAGRRAIGRRPHSAPGHGPHLCGCCPRTCRVSDSLGKRTLQSPFLVRTPMGKGWEATFVRCAGYDVVSALIAWLSVADRVLSLSIKDSPELKGGNGWPFIKNIFSLTAVLYESLKILN